MKYSGKFRLSRILSCLGAGLAVPLLIGASGGNCGGVEAGNVLVLEGPNGTERILVTNFYDGSVSLGPASLATSAGSVGPGGVTAITLENWDSRYVPYLMSADLDNGSLLATSPDCTGTGCALAGNWLRPSVAERTAEQGDLRLEATSAGLANWHPEKYQSVRVYDYGECRAETQMDFSQSGLATFYGNGLIAGLQASDVFKEAEMRFIDIRPFFRGPEARMAELIITPENFDQLFIDAGRTKRLRPLREIPAEYFLDGHHPMNGDYLAVTGEFTAPLFEGNQSGGLPGAEQVEWVPGLFFPIPYSDVQICAYCANPRVRFQTEVDVIVLNWDAMAQNAGHIWLNFDARGTSNEIPPRPYIPDSCDISPTSNSLFVSTAGDWVSWDSDSGVGFEWPIGPGDSTRVRRLYVDTSSIDLRFNATCSIPGQEAAIQSAFQRAYRYNFANGFLRRALEELMAVDPTGLPLAPIEGVSSCQSDAACMLQAYFGGVQNWQNFICVVESEDPYDPETVGSCKVLPQLERVMMTPERIIMVTADDPNQIYREQLAAAGQCSAVSAMRMQHYSTSETGSIGSPLSDWNPIVGSPSSGYSRYTANSEVEDDLQACDGDCVFDPALGVRPPL